MKTALLSFALLVVNAFAARASDLSSLPVGKIKVDVMEAVTAPRAAELSAKLQAAAQGDREQWLEDVKKAPADERLRWNERLGLTREEHAELQRRGSEVTLVKAAEAEIEFVRTSDGRIVLQPDSSLPELAGIVIDVDDDVVHTPFGRTTERSDVIGGEEQRLGGSWNGVQWKLEAPGKTLGTGTTVKLALGHLVYDGRGVLAYEAKSVEEGQPPRREHRVLVFSFR
jgi:hypothetical protein